MVPLPYHPLFLTYSCTLSSIKYHQTPKANFESFDSIYSLQPLLKDRKLTPFEKRFNKPTCQIYVWMFDKQRPDICINAINYKLLIQMIKNTLLSVKKYSSTYNIADTSFVGGRRAGFVLKVISKWILNFP